MSAGKQVTLFEYQITNIFTLATKSTNLRFQTKSNPIFRLWVMIMGPILFYWGQRMYISCWTIDREVFGPNMTKDDWENAYSTFYGHSTFYLSGVQPENFMPGKRLKGKKMRKFKVISELEVSLLQNI